MITTYSLQADFRSVAQRLAKDQRQSWQRSEHTRRPVQAEERERVRSGREDASRERVA
jgi:hypothetical protein